MRIIITVLTVVVGVVCASAQVFEVKTYNKTVTAFESLLLTNNIISGNDTLNEQIIDLLIPVVSDSIIKRKKQHHKIGPIGWMIHAFGGFNWRAVSLKKEKMVGTVVRQSRSRKERHTEYDINFDLNFHLRKYLFRVFDAYDRQGKIKRFDITAKRQRDYKSAPFVRDTNDIDIGMYRLHCELTPERAYRAALNYLFYPTLPGGGSVKGHPNFETKFPTVGFYGVFCLDCNHGCHPEMHPYEWMWWLKVNDSDSSTMKEWNLGVFHEGSNRMKKWSKNPKVGQVAIPFTMKVDLPMRIEIEHGVMNEFLEEGLKGVSIPTTYFDASSAKRQVRIEGEELSKFLDIHFINPINTEGLKYWIGDLNYDAELGLLSGFLYYAVAVEDVYTCQVRFINEK